MFVQTHIQRNHRPILSSNSINSSNKLYQQRHSNSLSSGSVGKQGRASSQSGRGKAASNRKIARDPSIDIPDETLNYSLANDSNKNKSIYSEKHQKGFQHSKASYSPETSYNLTQNNSFDETDESLIVKLDNSEKFERCRSKSVDSLSDLNCPALFPPSIFNKSSQANYESKFADPRTRDEEEMPFESFARNHSRPSDSFSPGFQCEPAAMISSLQDDGCYREVDQANGASYQEVEVNDMIERRQSIEIEENRADHTKISKIGKGSASSNRHLLNRLTIISFSKTNFELFSSFCRNFITYQLETWRLLADSATFFVPSSISTPIIGINTQSPMCSICHIVQSNIPEPPPRRGLFESEGTESEHLNNDLLQRSPTIRSPSCQFGKQPKMEPSSDAVIIEGARLKPFAGLPPNLHEPTRVIGRTIDLSVNQAARANNYLVEYNLDPRDRYMFDQENGNSSQQVHTLSRSMIHQNYRNNRIIHQASMNDQELSRGRSDPRQVSSNYHHLHRALTGIELGEGGQISGVPYENQKWQQHKQYHHQCQNRNNNHVYNKPQHHQKVVHNYRAKATEFPSSFSGSFDLSLDEKYPILPPVITDWNKRDNYKDSLRHQQLIGETKLRSIQRTASQLKYEVDKERVENNLIRSSDSSSESNIRNEVSSVEKKKSLLIKNQLNTGSDSELCSVKREQVLEETGVIRRPSISKPPSIEKISQTDASQLNKPNYYLSAKEDSRSVSPSSVDSSKLLTVGFGKSSKRISPSKLSLAGARRRLWMKQKGLSSLSVQRSEEIVPVDARHLVRQMTTNSLTDSGTESGSWISRSQIVCDPRACFVEGLGQGQIASRQALVSPYLGDIQLSLSDQRGMLEVEVVRARRLHAKPGAKVLPSPFVKIYLMKEKKCIAKFKTNVKQHTLDPLYQEKFIFRYDYENCVLQVIVWGDYGKKDRKSLMGVSQIQLGELDISNLVIDWYQLFNAPSMASSFISSKALRQTMLMKEESK